MKTVTTLAIVLGISLAANSQNFGVRIGGTLSDMKVSTDSIQYNTQLKPGFVGGLALEFPLKNTMAINTSLNFKSIGTWLVKSNSLVAWRINYIDLNVSYEYIIPLEKLDVFFEGGGYAGYALYGKEIIEYDNGTEQRRDLTIGTAESAIVGQADDIKPYDFGLIIGGGVRFGRYKLSASYQPSLVDISNLENWWFGNRVGVLSFTYYFND